MLFKPHNVLILVCALLLMPLLTGCFGLLDSQEIAMQTIDRVAGPVMDKAMAQLTAQAATIQGSANVVEPGFEIEIDMIVAGVPVHWKSTVKLVGTSATFQASTQFVPKAIPDAGPASAATTQPVTP